MLDPQLYKVYSGGFVINIPPLTRTRSVQSMQVLTKARWKAVNEIFGYIIMETKFLIHENLSELSLENSTKSEFQNMHAFRLKIYINIQILINYPPTRTLDLNSRFFNH